MISKLLYWGPVIIQILKDGFTRVYCLLTIALCTELVTLQALFAGLISIEARVT